MPDFKFQSPNVIFDQIFRIYIWIPRMRSKMTFENWNLKSGVAVAYEVAYG